MATYTPDCLAFLQLPDTKGDLYDPGTDKAQIHNIILHNTDTGALVVTLYHHDGTNEYIKFKVSLAANETLTLEFKGEGWVVNESSKITGLAGTAAKVTFAAHGSVVTA